MTTEEIREILRSPVYGTYHEEDIYDIHQVCRTLQRDVAIAYLNELKEIREVAPILKSISLDLWYDFKIDRNKHLRETYFKTNLD